MNSATDPTASQPENNSGHVLNFESGLSNDIPLLPGPNVTKRQAVADMEPGVDDRFGLCPQCVEADDCGAVQTWANIERNHFIYCEKHQVCWRVGSNLFSNWQHEDEAVWKRNAEKLSHMKEVESRYLPQTEHGQRERELREWQVKSMFNHLEQKQQDLIIALMLELTGFSVSKDGSLHMGGSNDFPPF